MELHFKLIERVVAIGCLALLAATSTAQRRPARDRWVGRLSDRAEVLFSVYLSAGALIYLALATLAKISQLQALELHGQDFWLFEDMLAQIARGGLMVTRYAPQAVGWVQHGAVHPMLSWILLAPLTWIIGPLNTALVFGPLVLAAAGWMLAQLVRPRAGALAALGVGAAFLASSHVARLLMYEVHPEALYPLLVFTWAWAAGWGDGKLRGSALLAVTVLLAGVKEDSFTVVLPLIAATAWLRRRDFQWLLASAAFALLVCGLELWAVHQWTTGAWGPHQWPPQGPSRPVLLTQASELLKGKHWDGPSSAAAILSDTLQAHGGLGQALFDWLKYWISRPWVGLLATAPWVLSQPFFWIAALPLSGVYALLGEPGKLINYYSAPVLGCLWLAASIPVARLGRGQLLWLLCASLLLGSSGLDGYLRSPEAMAATEDVRALSNCLHVSDRGIVSSRFVGLMPEDQIVSDRPPLKDDGITYFLFSTRLPSYEFQSQENTVFQKLKNDPNWAQLGKNCRILDVSTVPSGTDSGALLFVRKSALRP